MHFRLQHPLNKIEKSGILNLKGRRLSPCISSDDDMSEIHLFTVKVCLDKIISEIKLRH
jgi:hypothetical protein